MDSRSAGAALSALMLYFAYHAFAGEQGLGRWSDMQAEAEALEAELAGIEAEIARLRSDIDRLSPGGVDPDFVEALAREKLAFVYPDELILIE